MEQPVTDEAKIKVDLGTEFKEDVRKLVLDTYLDGAEMGKTVSIKTIEGVMNHPGLHQVQRDAMAGLKSALEELDIREVLTVNFPDAEKTDGLYPDH